MNESNISANFTEYDYTKETSWIIAISINVVLLFSTLWVLISLIHHGIQTEKWKNIPTSKSEKLNTGVVYSCVVAIAVFCFARLFFSIASMNVGYSKDDFAICVVMVETVSVAYACNIFSAMTFLWLRQRIFYTHRLLNVSYSKFTKVFSVISIFVIYVGGSIGFIWLRASSVQSTHRIFGCTSRTIFPPERTALYLVLIFSLTSFGQFTLLGLFIHALRSANYNPNKTPKTSVSSAQISTITKNSSLSNSSIHRKGSEPMSSTAHNNNIRNEASPQNSSAVYVGKNKVNNNASVKSTLKRTFIFAVVSVLADAFVPWAVALRNYRRAVLLIYNFNAFLNLMFVIFSFANFEKLIFSPCFKYGR